MSQGTELKERKPPVSLIKTPRDEIKIVKRSKKSKIVESLEARQNKNYGADESWFVYRPD
jgi:hypothetical protein